tara:strand:+ start:139 stop:708 length:570 start_codon:yes stop_codon:yes gene_type:complete
MYSKFLIFSFFLFFHFNLFSSSVDQDYCVGFLEEVYWSLDPIEDEVIRNDIVNFFNQKYPGAEKLDYYLYYDSNEKQFLTNIEAVDLKKYLKVHYPNFEVMVLDAYINLFKGENNNYCPAFWNNCTENSLNSFFRGAQDFSLIWTDEENVIDFLTYEFVDHKCSSHLRTSIKQKAFIEDLNILINELTK